MHAQTERAEVHRDRLRDSQAGRATPQKILTVCCGDDSQQEQFAARTDRSISFCWRQHIELLLQAVMVQMCAGEGCSFALGAVCAAVRSLPALHCQGKSHKTLIPRPCPRMGMFHWPYSTSRSENTAWACSSCKHTGHRALNESNGMDAQIVVRLFQNCDPEGLNLR